MTPRITSAGRRNAGKARGARSHRHGWWARDRASGDSLAYTAAKHGLVGYTRALAAQVAGEGITVNCLCPGWTNTSLVGWNALARAHGTDAAGARLL